MKVIIQIPCYNEEKTLTQTVASLPRAIVGVDKVELLVIDDGSTDRTSETARQCGVDHIVKHISNQGLARAFESGIDACLRLGADIIVNTDADNQYSAGDIPALVTPILEGRASMVVGARAIDDISEFSWAKKILQKLGSLVVRKISGVDVLDAPSGFRAISRAAAMQLNVFSSYTYTLETIIQAGSKNIAVCSVPVRVNPQTRPSRLVKSVFSYVRRSVLTMLRIVVVYKPFRFFALIGSVLLFAGVLIGVRFLCFYFAGHGKGNIQSLILASILIGTGYHTVLIAFVADILAVNRRLLEDIKYQNTKHDCDTRNGKKEI